MAASDAISPTGAMRALRPVDPAPTSGWLGVAYESVMVALAVTVIALLTQRDRGVVRWTSMAIGGVFVIDYFTRLAFSGDRKRFVRSNILDLLAILPADFFRAARALRMLRILRLLRAAVVLVRVFSTVRAVLGTNALGWVLAACALVVVLGAGTVMVAEPGLGHFGDAVWWAVVTATTVGYGDIAPATLAGRAVAVALMIVGIGALGMITGSVATHFVGQHDGPANRHLKHVRGLLDVWDDLSPDERRQAAAILETLASDTGREEVADRKPM